jgi:hypothetical protein
MFVQIRKARQDRFYDTRMKGAKALQKIADKKQVENEIHLIRAPGAKITDGLAKAEKSREKLRVPVEKAAKPVPMQE